MEIVIVGGWKVDADPCGHHFAWHAASTLFACRHNKDAEDAERYSAVFQRHIINVDVEHLKPLLGPLLMLMHSQ